MNTYILGMRGEVYEILSFPCVEMYLYLTSILFFLAIQEGWWWCNDITFVWNVFIYWKAGVEQLPGR